MRAAGLARALSAIAVVVGAVTCDSPTSLRQRISLAITLDLGRLVLSGFSGLVVDSVRLKLVRPPSDTIDRQTIAFSPDSAQISAQVTVQLNGSHELLEVVLEFLSGSQVMFTGEDTVGVTAGSTTRPVQIRPSYVGPGKSIATIQITPRDSGAVFGTAVQFTVTAKDSANQPVSQFYVSWSSARASDTINGAGVLRPASVRGWAWVRARTPTGIRDSARIQVEPVPSAIQIVSGNNQTATVGSAASQQLVVRVIAADNLPVVGVPVQFAATSGGGSVSPASAVTDTLGQAYATVTMGTVAGAVTVTASATGLTPVTFSATAVGGAATRLAFTVQPSGAVAGVAIAPAVQVAAQDGFGNTAVAFTGNVTIALGTNPGADTLSGTLTVAAVSGVATFTTLTAHRTGTGYTLSASATGLSGATSAVFNVTAGAAASLALVSGNGQAGTLGRVLPQPIVVKVTDAYGNGVASRTVTFAVASGGGSVSPASAATDTSGQVSCTWTLGPSGAQSLTVTAAGLSGSPLTVVANTSTTTLTPHADTLTALGATFQLAVQTRDGQGNPIAGATYSWASRAPAVATVNGSGLVTAVANGSTYVVATEAGGSKDSAQIVVQQQIATISVTPTTRSIYLTGKFTFTAAAVDGRNNPISGVTSFTWSSTAPAVASVDTSHATTNVVTAVGLGTAQIRAASGSVIGVANVTVLTPITRIAIVVDTVGAFKTDTFTLTSLGLTRRYRAIAHDTLDAVETGVAFTWVSTNGSVAVLDSVTATTARATSAANGVTQINATAQGFTSAPGASLTVSQVLASIELTPATATIAVSGSVPMTARGKDANSHFIAGGAFKYASATPSVATVDSLTGVVTGVSLGTANITASGGAVTSNTAVVTVSASVPPAISFGRDTLSVGRGSSTQIPILLSAPPANPLIVKLGLNGFAHWSAPTVTIPAGQTSVNATLVGDSAGTASATASDSSGLGYRGASAVVRVTANMHLTSCCYAINATDVVSTQVLLSDPSPAGGTYVTFSYSTPNVASVSPDPAFIPQGQLAADIQIRGVGAGTTNITPAAIGVNGAASTFTTYAPVLTPSTTFIRLGAGQYEPYDYVYLPTYTNVAVPVTLSSSDTNTIGVTPSVVIPTNSNYAYFTTTAKAIGSATITYSANGWTAANSTSVVSTTPYVGICCGYELNTTSPIQNVTVYAEDSVRTAHYRVNSLVVRLNSTDTTVIRVLDTVVTIQPGAYYTSSGRIVPGGLGGTAWVVATASGHRPDSTQFTVVGPKLNFSWLQNYIGAGQYDPYQYVYTPDYLVSPLVVLISNSNPTSVSLPAADTILAGTNYRYFTVTGNTPGTATFIASATGYRPDTAGYVVTSPRLTACCGYTLNNFSQGTNVTVYSADSLRSAHYRSAPLAVSVVSSDTTIVRVDSSTVTIAAGQYYSSAAHVTPVGVGTARIIFSAAGHVSLDTLTFTVVTPKVYISLSHYSPSPSLLGRRQHYDRNGNGFYVYTPDSRGTPVAATITQKRGAVDSLTTTTPTIPANSNYVYLDAYGLANGTDTLIVAAPGYLPDTAFIAVTTPQFASCCMPSSATTTTPPFGITVYATDSVGSGHYTMDTVVVHAVSSDSNVIRPAQPFFRILKNAYYANTTVNVVGPGTASLTYSDSALSGYRPTSTGTVTVTGPSFGISNGAPVLGMRQTGGPYSSYVYTQNNVTSPLVVHLLSTSMRVVTVPDSVIIPTGLNYAYFLITAQDTLGTIQIQATATGYTTATTTVQVTQPKFVVSTPTQLNTTSPKQSIYVYAADANGSAHYTTEPVTVTLASSAPSVAIIDSSTVTIPSGAYYTGAATWGPGIVGTSQLSASDARAVFYKYNTGTANVGVVMPSVNFSWGTRYLGIGQYDDYAYAYTPDNMTSPTTVSLSHTGTPRTSTFANLTTTPITSLTIPQGSNYQYFRLAGATTGTDTLVASISTPAHNSGTAYTVVGQGRIDPLGNWPSALRVGDSLQVTLYARDPIQGTHYVLAATTFTLAPNANIEFRSGGPSSALITSVTIPADQYYVTFYVKGVSAGTGSATISATNYQTYTPPTVTVSP